MILYTKQHNYDDGWSGNRFYSIFCTNQSPNRPIDSFRYLCGINVVNIIFANEIYFPRRVYCKATCAEFSSVMSEGRV